MSYNLWGIMIAKWYEDMDEVFHIFYRIKIELSIEEEILFCGPLIE